MRGIAVLLVMVLHFALVEGATGAERLFFGVTRVGWVGVDLFFVLSGFLITGILYDARGGAHFFRNFYMRRVLRIFPLYYAFLFLVLVLLPIARPASAAPAGTQFWLWTYLSNVLFARVGWEGMPGHTTHLWSLAIEEQFYLLWPLALLVLLRVRRETALVIVVGLTLASGAWRGFLFATGASVPRLYNGFDTHADGLLLGCALALAGRAEWRRLALAWPLAVASLILAAALLPWRHPLVYAGGLWFIALAATILIAAIASGHAVGLVRLLQLAPLAWLGVISYGFYLWHYPVLMLLRGHGGGLPGPALVVGAFAITLAAAVASWHLLESPATRLRPRAMQRAD
jgi:peptidoglycan/LPS O-acetylase OafA/YrhL